MDVTNVFRACVKTVKVRNKMLYQKKANGVAASDDNRSRDYNFSRKSRHIVRNTTELRDFLLRNRKLYLSLNNLWSGVGMSDFDRDKIDSETETIIKATNHLLSDLKASLSFENSCLQIYTHRKAVVDIISSYVKAVCKIYSEQRAVRVKKAADLKRMSRLETLVRGSKLSNIPNSLLTKDETEEESGTNPQQTSSVLRHRKGGEGVDHEKKPKESKTAGFLFGFEEEGTSDDQTDLTVEERQQLSKENDQLYERMNSLVDEIQQIEGKVIEISKLQDVFTEKVLEQERDIYRINEVAIITTENIKSGNEQIREAMKKRASMRVYILFILIVLSFTLLFLDWYNG